MKKGKIKVDQIYNNSIVTDYDQVLNKSEIYTLLKLIFRSYLKREGNIFYFKSKSEKTLKLLFKNITYLGRPHPTSKKRIQVPKEYRSLLQDSLTLLVGIYHYEGKMIFSIFSSFDYIYKKMNNSSAHINIEDLLYCSINGIRSRLDENRNLVLILNENNIEPFLEYYSVQHKSDDDIEILAILLRQRFL